MHAAVSRSVLHGAPVSLTPSLSRVLALSLFVRVFRARLLAVSFPRICCQARLAIVEQNASRSKQSHSNRKRVLANALGTPLRMHVLTQHPFPRVHG